MGFQYNVFFSALNSLLFSFFSSVIAVVWCSALVGRCTYAMDSTGGWIGTQHHSNQGGPQQKRFQLTAQRLASYLEWVWSWVLLLRPVELWEARTRRDNRIDNGQTTILDVANKKTKKHSNKRNSKMAAIEHWHASKGNSAMKKSMPSKTTTTNGWGTSIRLEKNWFNPHFANVFCLAVGCCCCCSFIAPSHIIWCTRTPCSDQRRKKEWFVLRWCDLFLLFCFGSAGSVANTWGYWEWMSGIHDGDKLVRSEECLESTYEQAGHMHKKYVLSFSWNPINLLWMWFGMGAVESHRATTILRIYREKSFFTLNTLIN